MTSTDKLTIPIKTGTVIVLFSIQFTATIVGIWAGFKIALKDIDHKIDIVSLEYKQADELMKKDIQSWDDYFSKAIRPDEIRPEQSKRKKYN